MVLAEPACGDNEMKRFWWERDVSNWRIYDHARGKLPKMKHYIAVAFTEKDAEMIVKALNAGWRLAAKDITKKREKGDQR